MNHTRFWWRRVYTLSATFLLLLALTISCKKKTTDVGLSAIDKEQLIEGGGIDTFSLLTYSKLDDTVLTKNPAISILGTINDPVFGIARASIYTQFRLTASNPVFEPSSKILIDSFVLSMAYTGFTGKTDAQTFEVYELDDTLSSHSSVKYYVDTDFPIKSTNRIMPASATQKMEWEKPAIIDSVASVPQLRLHLDTSIARDFVEKANGSGDEFSSNEKFLEYFKGLCIKTDGSTPASGQGGVGYFNLTDDASRLTMYYRVVQSPGDTLNKSYFIRVNSSSVRYTKMDFARSAKVQNVIDNPSMGQSQFYAQALGLRGVIELPTITNLPKSSTIHKAELFLPVEYQTGQLYEIGSYVTIAADVFGDGLFALNLGTYSDFRKGYVVDVRAFVQQVVSGGIENMELFVGPQQFITSANRVVFNGSNTTNKLKPKLTIIYSEF